MSPNSFSSVHKPVKVSAGPPPAVYATRAWPAGRGSRSALRPSPTAHASAKPRPAGPFLCPCRCPCLHTHRSLYSPGPLAHCACICRAAPSEHTKGRARPSCRDPPRIARRPGTEQTALALSPARTRRNWNNPGASHHHEATCSPGRYPRVHVSHFNSKQA